MRLIWAVVYLLVISMSLDRDVFASDSIDCGYETNGSIKLEKANINVICKWHDSDNALNYLIQRKLDKKARTLSLRVFNSDQKFTDKPVEMTTRTHIEERDSNHYIVKYDIYDGKKKLAKISTESSWASNISWEIDPKLVTEPDRKILKLKTHDGLDYYSFYYLPQNFDASQKQKIVVLLKGGTGAYKHEPDYGDFMGAQTVSFLREAGYIPLLANFRGKQRLSNKFRSTGPGQMHNHGIKDIVTAMDALSQNVNLDKSDIRVIGHSRGGHMAILLATRLSDINRNYKISKSVVSSGVFNPVDGYYSFYKDLDEIIVPEKNLDFVDDDWTNGALVYRPTDKFTDYQWEQIQKIEKEHFDGFFSRGYDRQVTFAQTQTYFNQSAFHHAENLQGTVLALTGSLETHGNCSFHGPYQFQKKVGKDRVTVKLHEWGHGFPRESYLDYNKDPKYAESMRKGMRFWKNEVLNFLED
jgi:pimeloyl-ACP methyl ester carboxylesterase